MPFTPTVIARDLDPDVFIDAAIQLLLTDGTITALLGDTTAVFSEAADRVITGAYIILQPVSLVLDSDYNEPRVNGLLDIKVYKAGWATAGVRDILRKALKRLITATWTVPEFRMNSIGMEEVGTGFRNVSELVTGEMRRGRAFTVRYRATKIA